MRGERTQQGKGEEPSFLFTSFPLSAPDLLMLSSQSGEIWMKGGGRKSFNQGRKGEDENKDLIF